MFKNLGVIIEITHFDINTEFIQKNSNGIIPQSKLECYVEKEDQDLSYKPEVINGIR